MYNKTRFLARGSGKTALTMQEIIMWNAMMKSSFLA